MQLHYRVTFTPCAQERALLIPRAGMGYTVLVDGVPTQRLGPLPDGTPEPQDADAPVHNPRVPMLLRVPPGAQTVDFHMQGLAFLDMGLPVLRVGSTHNLAPVHAGMYRRVIEWTLNAGHLITVFALLGLWGWSRRPRDHGLMWFLIASTIWVVRGHFGTLTELPFHTNGYELAVALQVVLMAPSTLAATLHILRRWHQRWAVSLGVSTAFCALLLTTALLLPAHAHGLRSLAYAITMAWLVLAFLLALRHRKALPGWRGTLVVCGYVALLFGIGKDYLYVMGILTVRDDGISMLVWGYLALLLCLLVVLTDHALNAVDRIRRLNVELDQRVGERTREIAHLYAQRETEQLAYADTQARLQERERLVREIHDGIGGQLTTTLRAVERGRFTPEGLGQSLQECLDDLRLVMDASSSHERLDAALAAWRHRWDTRLELLGVVLHWRVQDPLDDGLGAQAVLHLLRVLQEAVTNALKHAQATRVEVFVALEALSNEAPHLVLQIRDNGRGWTPNAHPSPSQGRGLVSMRQRAQTLGATLAIQSAPGEGAAITVRVPLPAVSAQARAALPPA